MKHKLVICNKADRKECPKCSHGFIHAAKNMTFIGENCTNWTECYDAHGEYLFKVRCVSIDSKEGEKVIQNLDKKGEPY